VYVIGPFLYVYDTDEVRNRDGERLPGDASITSVAYAAGINVVTTKKILGGNYGFQALFPVGINNRLQGTEIDANPGGGLSDSAVAPIASAGTSREPISLRATPSSFRRADTSMARTTTPASACGARNRCSAPRSI